MACCPFGIDGLLSDEAMAPTLRVFVDLVHPALIEPVFLIVVVRNNTLIDPTVRRRKIPQVGKGYKGYKVVK